jgi:hypothetical protein
VPYSNSSACCNSAAVHRFTQSTPVQLCGCLSEFRHGGEQRHAPSGGLVERLQPFKRGQCIVGLRGMQGGDLRAFGQILHQPVSVTFGFTVGAERRHAPLSGHLPRHAVRITPLAPAVNRGESSATVFDALWVFHVCAFSFSRFLCQNCVSSTRNLILLRKTGCRTCSRTMLLVTPGVNGLGWSMIFAVWLFVFIGNSSLSVQHKPARRFCK